MNSVHPGTPRIHPTWAVAMTGRFLSLPFHRRSLHDQVANPARHAGKKGARALAGLDNQ